MGWGYGIVQDKEVGYTVEAVCEHEGCDCKIDRGLSYACGGMGGEDEYSCNGFFCEKHKANWVLTDYNETLSVCDSCKDILLDSGDYVYDEMEDCLVRKSDA